LFNISSNYIKMRSVAQNMRLRNNLDIILILIVNFFLITLPVCWALVIVKMLIF